MISVHETEVYINSYPTIFYFILLPLCYVYHVSYVYVIGYMIQFIINDCLKLFFLHAIGSAGNRPFPYHTPRLVSSVPIALGADLTKYLRQANAYGFPSGHAQSVGYFLAFMHQFLPWRKWHPGWVVFILLFAAVLMYTRIAFRYHTPIQVLFGFVFGVAIFRAFHWIVTKMK